MNRNLRSWGVMPREESSGLLHPMEVGFNSLLMKIGGIYETTIH